MQINCSSKKGIYSFGNRKNQNQDYFVFDFILQNKPFLKYNYFNRLLISKYQVFFKNPSEKPTNGPGIRHLKPSNIVCPLNYLLLGGGNSICLWIWKSKAFTNNFCSFGSSLFISLTTNIESKIQEIHQQALKRQLPTTVASFLYQTKVSFTQPKATFEVVVGGRRHSATYPGVPSSHEGTLMKANAKANLFTFKLMTHQQPSLEIA
ncbi:hypothetical protein EGR_07938 [Echinococcus granulosus]|uniref:Uncharacterized protein n=1 Tax=Echinococcus granulosus TaxID=6210 RepID=W6UUV2_ECHGR|nr:hypothetical protein EGR_07938 [Echinococcus granulosus]EUB57189.1 hypothetical protein EGR_07938 [Echinococcus granulosus]